MSEHNLSGKKVAFLLTDGVEQVELTSPWDAVKEAGGVPTLVSPKSGELQGYDGTEKGQRFAVDLAVGRADAADFHALVIPGGVVSGRNLTSYHTLQTDLRNAGAIWTNEEVVVDQGLVTSRSPRDLPAFNAKLLEEIAEGEHAGQTP